VWVNASTTAAGNLVAETVGPSSLEVINDAQGLDSICCAVLVPDDHVYPGGYAWRGGSESTQASGNFVNSDRFNPYLLQTATFTTTPTPATFTLSV
jgi:hypothetical protein